MEICRAFEILLDLSRIHKNGINSASEVESGKNGNLHNIGIWFKHTVN